MGLLGTLKKVLFDEDEVEITVNNDELPTKPNKKPEKVQGFKDYHEGEDEDTIKEVKVPKEEPEVVEEEDDSNKNQDNEIAGETYDSSGKINEKL